MCFVNIGFEGWIVNLEEKLSLKQKIHPGKKALNSPVIKIAHAKRHNSINLLPLGNAIKCSMKQRIAVLLMCTLFFNLYL